MIASCPSYGQIFTNGMHLFMDIKTYLRRKDSIYATSTIVLFAIALDTSFAATLIIDYIVALTSDPLAYAVTSLLLSLIGLKVLIACSMGTLGSHHY